MIRATGDGQTDFWLGKHALVMMAMGGGLVAFAWSNVSAFNAEHARFNERLTDAAARCQIASSRLDKLDTQTDELLAKGARIDALERTLQEIRAQIADLRRSVPRAR